MRRLTGVRNVADPTTTALRLIQLYGPLAVAIFTFLESSMLFPFLPSEVVAPAAAALLISDGASFVVFVAAAGFGGTAGAFVPFYAFYGPGSRMVDWLGDHAGLSEDRIERSRRWFLEWGASSVLWGRFLPGLRSVISVPAGLFGMNPAWFGLLTAIGTVGFYATVAGAVYFLQRESIGAVARDVAANHPVLGGLVLAGGLAAVLVVTVAHRRAAG